MSKPIRILFLETILDRGGAEAMTMNYYRSIDRNLFQFDFLVHREQKGAYEDEITKLGGKIYRICPPYPQNYFRYMRTINHFFKSHPEYKIIHNNMTETGLFAFKAAKKSNIPIRICHAHTAHFNSKPSLKKLVLNIYNRAIKKYTTHRFACGELAAKYVFGDTKNVYIMDNAIDCESFRISSSLNTSMRIKYSLDENDIVIGHVGRFSEPKNHIFLINFFKKLASMNKRVKLLLVGDGEKREEIERYVRRCSLSQKVVFVGSIGNVNEIMQCFDIFVLPSLWEGFPVALVEAQASGLPCFVSDKISNECIITNNVTVLSLDDVDNWAKTINENISIGKDFFANDAVIKAGFDIKTNAKKLEDFYRECLKNNN